MPYKNKDKMREYQREYSKRPKTKQKRRQQRRERYRNDTGYRERLKIRSKKYQDEHDKKPNTQYRRDSNYREKKLKYMRDYQRKLRQLTRDDPTNPKAQAFLQYRRKYQKQDKAKRTNVAKTELIKLIGANCLLCGRGKVVYHQIHGQRHPYLNFSYQVKHKDDFAPLCPSCHIMVHRMMRLFAVSWKTILNLKNKARDPAATA